MAKKSKKPRTKKQQAATARMIAANRGAVVCAPAAKMAAGKCPNCSRLRAENTMLRNAIAKAGFTVHRR